MEKKYIWGIGVLFLVLIVALVGWAVYQGQNSGDSIKIGVVLPLTGPLAEYGEAYRNGITLAQKDFGSQNKNVEFIFEDGQYDPAKSINAFNKLTQIDKVNVAVSWGTAPAFGIAPLTKNTKIPYIAAATPDSSIVANSPYVIRQFGRPEEFTDALWNYFRANNMKKIGIVKTKLLFLDLLTESLQNTKRADETVDVVDTYQNLTDKDFRTNIAKLKQSDYDAIGVFLISGQVSQFYKQAKELGMTKPTFGTDFMESQNEINDSGNSMDGVVYPNYDISSGFRQAYNSQFKNDNQIAYGGSGYDLAKMLFTKVDFTSADTVVNSIKSMGNFEGSLGKYFFSEKSGDRYFSAPIYVKKIVDSEITTLK